MPSPSDAFLPALAAAVAGRVATPADPDWTPVSMSWNLALHQQPAAVLLPAGPDDVVAAVRVAAEHGVAVAAQADGHSSTAALDGTLLVRTAGFDEIAVDGDVATIGAGVRWAQLQERLVGTGLVGVAGSHPDINVVAFALGGGHSWFSRSYGWGSGQLLAAEVVTGSGERRWVDDASDPELIRALRGGGGDFAIVLAARIRLRAAPAISGGLVEYPGEAAEAVSAAFLDLVGAAPEESSWTIDFARVPPLPQIPVELHGASLVRVGVVHLGAASELVLSVEALDAAGPVLRSTIADRTPAQLGEVAEEPRDPSPALHRAVVADRIDAELLGILLELHRSTPALLAIGLRQLGGALAREPALPSTAGASTAGALINALAIVVDEASAQAAEAAFAALDAALAARVVPGLPFTFLGDRDGLDRSYPAEAIAGLRRVKAAVDPQGVIRGNHPVGG